MSNSFLKFCMQAYIDNSAVHIVLLAGFYINENIDIYRIISKIDFLISLCILDL